MKKIIQMVCLSFMLISCQNKESKIKFTEIKHVYKSVSPTVSAIQELKGSDKKTAISKLIKKGERDGFPLIELDSLGTDYVYATFLYVDSTHRHKVNFEVFGIYDEHRFGDRQLYRLDSTDVYYRSYMIPHDLCFSYHYILTDKISGKRQRVVDYFNNDLIPRGNVKAFSWSVLDLRSDEMDWNENRFLKIDSKLDTFQIRSSLLENSRNIYVYLPDSYTKFSKQYPVIYLFDSFIYLNRVEVPNILDNLIHQEKIEPMLAVFIDNPTRTSRDYELPMNPVFKNFVVDELLPEIRRKYRVTDKAEETIIGGMSYGGLAATYIGFDCDSIFGNVLSQSGAFWRDTIGALKYAEMNRTDYLIKRFMNEEKREIKLYADWGLQEDMVLGSNRKLIKVLDNRAYDFSFIEFNGWHDWSNSRKTFPKGLMYLLKKNKCN